MSGSPTFFRRVAPAVLVGTAAVTLVGLFDPVFGSRDDDLAAAPASATSPQSTTSDRSSRKDISSPTEPAQSDPTQAAQSDQSTQGAAASCDSGQEVMGDSISTRWGPVQVAATVAGGQLCQVYAVEYPYGDPKSAHISDQVIPYLDEAATQLGADFDAVSGATYTSEGYRDSVQSIIDQL